MVYYSQDKGKENPKHQKGKEMKTRYDYYFEQGAVISWYNKRMTQRSMNYYIKQYGRCFKVVEVKG